jgi:hypothetical protein
VYEKRLNIRTRLNHPILKIEEWSGEGQMTIDVTGGACINPMVEAGYTFLTIKHEEGARGGIVVEALRYKPEGRGIDFRWYHWKFSLT